MKVVMAITGLIMVGFLLMHMYGNLKVFLGADAFNHYAHWLKGDILYPLVPSGWFIWIFRLVMLASIVAHIWSAAVLTGRAHAARSTKYVTTKRLSQTYAARTMRWGGVILLVGLIFHLLQFTTQTVQTGFTAGAEPYEMTVGAFGNWWLVLLYAVWVGIVCSHVRHGVWSALTTLGANTSPAARSFLNGLAWVIAVVLFVGFMIMPLAVLFGWVN
ncbi:succinate dehydrogenase cytochrome b subunit [Propioniciclava sinopodophylli]|uniref:Succinate dehydrogenase cytochrome b subunit n=1 Tax=Propioniciclava sinopodophylli TaxID=1837344 RepID=A0A4Q9KD48_9ACTN|nr:succinate dehydrogenase cytochrome b subunit [Propioniciclava sinopodophylli]TBT84336.1 succinate dehydrogenase cytochrome b subunit [Propioniciclava sinopodophylli]